MNSKVLWGATEDDWTAFSVLAGLTEDLLPYVADPSIAPSNPQGSWRPAVKMPGVIDRTGRGHGIAKWNEKRMTAREIDRFAADDRHGICVVCRQLKAIDVDITDPVDADLVEQIIVKHLGQLPTRRRGNSSKFLVAFMLPGEIDKVVLKCEKGLIEFPGHKQQVFAIGTHPSGERYVWDGGTPTDFPDVSIDAYRAVMAELEAQLAVEKIEEFNLGRTLVKQRTAIDINDDMVEFLGTEGWVKRVDPSGKVFIRCPFEHEHTTADSDDTATCYFPKGVGGFEQGHFMCQHGHCRGRNDGEFIEAVGFMAAQFDVVEYEPEPGVIDPPSFARNPQTGKILATISNLMLALRSPEWLTADVAFDDFRSELMITRAGRREWRPFIDADYTRLRLVLEAKGLGVGSEMIREAVGLRGDENRFDSAILWLENEVPAWDGVPRIDGFYPTYWGAEDTAYTRAVGAYTWTALAGRVLSPGCQADMVPILFGGQGIGKSRGVAAMVPSREFFAELDLGDRDTDKGRLMRGKLIGELGELKGLHSREIESIKSFITSEVDEWTPKYKEFAIKMKRRLVFMGTTNRREFLADETGNRRWLPLEATRVDRDGIVRDRLQLWAEARDRWKAGGVEFHKAERLATDHHDSYRIRDMWEETVSTWLFEVDPLTNERPADREMTAADILVGALRFEPKSVKRGDEMRLSKVLGALGMVSRQLPPSKGRHRVWKIPS